MAKALCSSNLVPKDYQGPNGHANALIALEMAQRVGASPMAVMQNMHIIHGRPSWSSSFIIASLNSCGRFSPIRFEMTGEGDAAECRAWAIDNTGERLEGPPSSIAMAKAEGWATKNGSKWKTMPELMLRYRAAAFFGRLYAPDILMGMHSDDEVKDMPAQQVKEVAPALVVEPEPLQPVAETVETVEAEVVAEKPKPKPRAPRKTKPNPAPKTVEAEVVTDQEPPPLKAVEVEQVAAAPEEKPKPAAKPKTEQPTAPQDLF